MEGSFSRNGLFKIWNWTKGNGSKRSACWYQNEGYTLFEDLIENVKFSVIRILMNFDKSFIIQNQENKDNVKTTQIIKDKIGRNDPCYCGSGIKYKKCGIVDKCIKKS